MIEWLKTIEQSSLYTAALIFYGLHPMLTSVIWMVTGMTYFRRRDLSASQVTDDSYFPWVSVLIPAYCEEKLIGSMLSTVLQIDYPNFEVIVINDGSDDGTAEEIKPYLSDPRLRLLDKKINEGKAMALNDAILCARGEFLLTLDADSIPDPMVLRRMVPHFQSARVAGVAGNARVRNRRTLIAKLQAVEFTSVIGLLRRSQRIWGRVMCVSGVVGMFRKSALVDVGMYTPGMATEDIDLTWKLQMRYYDIRYEPRAIVWMVVPETLGVWWTQRRRWALGLGQVLRRHKRIMTTWSLRRMYPLYVESFLSMVWALVFLIMTLFWCFCYAMGHAPRGGSPIPNVWGMLLVTICLMQLACGIFIDRKYEPSIVKDSYVSILYPSFYWVLLASTCCIYTVRGIFRTLNLNAPTR